MSQQPETTKTILIVEDDPDIGCVLFHTLSGEGYEIVLATTGQQGLNLAQEAQPNIFILNYWLPDMNGVEAYDHLHAMEEFKHVPALMISANLPQQEIAARGIVGIEKPFDVDNLLETIKSLIT